MPKTPTNQTMDKTSPVSTSMSSTDATLRQQLRLDIRRRRQALTPVEQQQAGQDLAAIFANQPQLQQADHIALYLTNDAELDTHPLIQMLWQQGKTLYLPVMHPFCPGYLLFQRYSAKTPMQFNRFGIAEPVLDCSQICPLSELSLICLPLVAFDAAGNRMGMGGGFYDRTLSQLSRTTVAPSDTLEQKPQPWLLGLAHQCQQVPSLPQQAWDIPLDAVLTPKQLFLP
jgi:5-formyltetrahydrofolate cyclo-ligase